MCVKEAGREQIMRERCGAEADTRRRREVIGASKAKAQKGTGRDGVKGKRARFESLTTRAVFARRRPWTRLTRSQRPHVEAVVAAGPRSVARAWPGGVVADRGGEGRKQRRRLLRGGDVREEAVEIAVWRWCRRRWEDGEGGVGRCGGAWSAAEGD